MKAAARVAALLFACLAIGAQAQSPPYPSRAITMLVPLQAGTAVDNVARAIAQKMSANLGRPIVVENVAGAAGQIGTERLVRAAPDGYTIGFVNDSILTMLPNLNPKLGYDPLKDLAPVSRVAGNAFGIAVNPAFPAKSLADLIAQAKARPGEIHYATGGNGSPQHMVMEMLASTAGVKLSHVPYKGAAQALTDVLGGQVPVLAQGLGVMSAQAKAGKLRVLAVTGPARSPLLPDVPTVREAGFADFEFATWFAVVAPAGMPRAIVDLLNAEIVKAAAAPEVRDVLVPLGYDIAPGTPEALTESIRAGLGRMGQIIREAGIKAE